MVDTPEDFLKSLPCDVALQVVEATMRILVEFIEPTEA
jgi:hypothetical protein